jgi:hypothetical protein
MKLFFALALVGALLSIGRSRNGYRRLANGTTRAVSPSAPRPGFVAAMIVVIVLAIVAAHS